MFWKLSSLDHTVDSAHYARRPHFFAKRNFFQTFQYHVFVLNCTPFDRARQGEHIDIKFISFQAILRLEMNFKVLAKRGFPAGIPYLPMLKLQTCLICV